MDDDERGILKQTRSLIYIFEQGEIVYQCWGLERPWLDNKRRVSCIPVGTYDYRMYNSTPTFNYSLIHVLDVPDRSEILFHRGNYKEDTSGCILLGSSYAHINSDEYLDIVNSTRVVSEFMSVLSEVGKEKGKVKFISSVPDVPMTIV